VNGHAAYSSAEQELPPQVSGILATTIDLLIVLLQAKESPSLAN
jgi:hypothetical protein